MGVTSEGGKDGALAPLPGILIKFVFQALSVTRQLNSYRLL